MPEGGKLTLSAANIVISAETLSQPDDIPGRYILLSVTDTGTGIPRHLFSRIFEPFFTTKSPDKGTGLGLSTVASIVKRHKGFVRVQSGLGKGTRFNIYLPAAESEQPTESKPRVSTLPTGHGELILVVDDEQLVLELAKSTLENYGYHVVTAPNGLEAIACFEAHKNEIRLVVTDTDMPFLDGKNAIKAIQKINPHVSIIVASGTNGETTDPIDSTHIIALQKPYGVEQLLECVAKVLSGSTTERDSAKISRGNCLTGQGVWSGAE
jgi:CheY-like chemotaxis protein